MSHDVPVIEQENTVRIKTTFADDNGDVVKPDNTNAFIEIVDIDSDETVVSETTMTNVSDTQYQFDWTTTQGTTCGEYIAKAQGEISNDTISNKERFRIDDIV